MWCYKGCHTRNPIFRHNKEIQKKFGVAKYVETHKPNMFLII